MSQPPEPSAPISAEPQRRPGLRDALVAFRYRNFSLFWWGALVSNTGSWIQNVTIPFVIYNATGSKAVVGIVGFWQFIPIAAMGPMGGSIADRMDRKTILVVTQLAQAFVALALWGLWAKGDPSLGALIGLVVLSSFITGINIPSWQAFVSELVPREVMLNAVTLNSTQFNAARAFGPAIGGLILFSLGVSWCFLINAVSFLAVIGALLLIRLPHVQRASPLNRASIRTEFFDSVRYSRASPGIVACFIVVVALGGLGSPMVQLFIVFAREVFAVDDRGYGLMGAALGIGSILAAPLIAGRGSGMRRSRLVEISLLSYGAAIVVFGLAPNYAIGIAALLVAGAGYLSLASTLNTTIQIQVREEMRGKVIAVYIMLLTVAMPFGVLLQGLLAQVVGPRVAVAGFGAAFLAITAWLRFRVDYLSHLDDEHAQSYSGGASE